MTTILHQATFRPQEEDVELVLRKNWSRVSNTDGHTFEDMADRLLNELDIDAVVRAGSVAGPNEPEQIAAAHSEIESQLVTKGLLTPLRQAARRNRP